jgi:hypothetical protein
MTDLQPSSPESRFAQIQKTFSNARVGFEKLAANGGQAPEAQSRKTVTGSMGSNWSLATARTRDPLWYWKQNNLPFDIWRDQTGMEMRKVHELCRLLYVTHPLLGSAVDIYSRFPLTGMEIVCGKDQAIADFYRELFFDDLNYEEYLVDIGREHWLVGEAIPLGSFNDLTGAWDSDDLMIPEDVNVIKTPFAPEPRYEMALPWSIRKILNDRYPVLEYRQLVENYPEFLAMNISDWLTMDNPSRFMIPVSGALMQQVMRKGDSFYHRGIPILMRAFRAVAQEEMLNSAQDSISQRLYTPLLMAKIGASATDLGMDTAWIPSQKDLDDFVEDVNAALAADFRLIVTHFAANIQSVFGRENMPDLSGDYTRLEDKMLQAFGLSRTMLSGAGQGETYAADSLHFDLVGGLLMEFQRKIRKFFRKRCEIVAEAQGHYDYNLKGGRPVPIMERVQETDEETGDIRFVERPKLLLPELRLKAMNLKDEQQQADLLSELRASGVPISQRSRLVNVPIDLDAEAEATMNEQVEQAVMAQQVRRRTYLALMAQGLPIPEDLKKDFEAHVQGTRDDKGGDPATNGQVPGQPTTDANGQVIPTVGLVTPAPTDALVPNEQDAAALPNATEQPESQAPERRNRALFRSRPEESDEQRATMPKAAWKLDETVADEFLFERGIAHKITIGTKKNDDGTEEATYEEKPLEEVPVLGSWRLRHIGRRDKAFFWKEADASTDFPWIFDNAGLGEGEQFGEGTHEDPMGALD